MFLFISISAKRGGPRERGYCGGLRPTGHKHSPGEGSHQGTLTGLQHCWTYSPELWEEARRGGVAEADQRVIKDGPEAIHGTSDESDASNLLIHEKS